MIRVRKPSKLDLRVNIRVTENDLEIAQAYAKLLHRQLQETSAVIAALEMELEGMQAEDEK